jgi:hypothetical protein
MNRTLQGFVDNLRVASHYRVWSVHKEGAKRGLRSHIIQKLIAPDTVKPAFIDNYTLYPAWAAEELLAYCVKKYGYGENFEIEEIYE